MGFDRDEGTTGVNHQAAATHRGPWWICAHRIPGKQEKESIFFPAWLAGAGRKGPPLIAERRTGPFILLQIGAGGAYSFAGTYGRALRRKSFAMAKNWAGPIRSHPSTKTPVIPGREGGTHRAIPAGQERAQSGPTIGGIRERPVPKTACPKCQSRSPTCFLTWAAWFARQGQERRVMQGAVSNTPRIRTPMGSRITIRKTASDMEQSP